MIEIEKPKIVQVELSEDYSKFVWNHWSGYGITEQPAQDSLSSLPEQR